MKHPDRLYARTYRFREGQWVKVTLLGEVRANHGQKRSSHVGIITRFNAPYDGTIGMRVKFGDTIGERFIFPTHCVGGTTISEKGKQQLSVTHLGFFLYNKADQRRTGRESEMVSVRPLRTCRVT